ncbi:M24 family metallopeptidase [Candidatus Cyanaurora vandensis]|uniref:M24 family metallopeptidase n=2 Tax=Candidatus Cyanaurora vandensis TaxID=2714958 RepID=UPI00257A613A|nr:M24 family metallopeptidase [Candidatus Cyanaurora vandensis]
MTATLPLAHDLPHYVARPAQAQVALENLGVERGVDCVFVTAQDAFLSEYNVLANNHRYALSNFSGSTGDGIFLSARLSQQLDQAQFLLFVDGRYHLQADQEIDPNFVQVVKLDVTQTMETGLLGWLEAVPATELTVAIDGARTTWKRFIQLQEICKERGFTLQVWQQEEISTALALPGWSVTRPVAALPTTATGRTTAGNLNDLHRCLPADLDPDRTCILTCMSDDVAWLVGARGFHMPNASSFLADGFVVGRDIILFLPPGTETTDIQLPTATDYRVILVRGSLVELTQVLSAYSVTDICFSERASNAFLPTFALGVWAGAALHADFFGLEMARAQKTPEELAAIRAAFLKSSRAIARTLRWVKSSIPLAAGTVTEDATFVAPVSELDLSEKIAREYLAQGAVELSFRTIAATGANGAIIHYGNPRPENLLQDGDLTLLDSGAYYGEGFATDCTRVAFCNRGGSTPQPWQREIYTVTLKACIRGMTAVFPCDLPCKELDRQVRAVCQQYGYDYAHGTGHGVGIHVHESGIRLSPVSTYGFTENAVVSIEPGIYLPGQGGVRIENVAVVRAHPTLVDHFYFENLAFVGMDWELIDLGLLDESERTYLREYEAQCAALGNTVTPCPL